MVDTIITVLVGIIGLFGGYYLGSYLNVRTKSLKDHNKYYAEMIDDYQTEIRKLKGKIGQIKKGVIPYEALDANSDEQFIDGIFNALPPNLAFLKSFKGTALKYLKENPEIKDTAIEFIKTKAGQQPKEGEGEKQIATNESL